MKKSRDVQHIEKLIIGDREVRVFEDRGRMMDSAAGLWEEIAARVIEENDRFVVALSGGKTPVGLYERLVRMRDFPWDVTHLFMVDERFVPYDSDENNYKMINCTLVRHLGVPAKNVHPILTTESTSEDAARRYEGELRGFFRMSGDKVPAFDLILLGIGNDGHTASLFPGTDVTSFGDAGCMAASTMRADGSGHERITLTLPVLNSAEHILFLATGESKAQVVKEVVEDGKSLLPAALVRPRKGRILFYLDKGAASLLKR